DLDTLYSIVGSTATSGASQAAPFMEIEVMNSATNTHSWIHRAAALALLSLLVAVSCDEAGDELFAEEDAAATPRASGPPELWMPFPAGTIHMCTQGNHDTPSHNKTITAHALDFDTSDDEAIHAAQSGKVSYVERSCVAGQPQC